MAVKLFFLVSSILSSTSAIAQDACLVHEERIAAIGAKYEAEFLSIERDATTIANDANKISEDETENLIGVDVDISMRREKIVFDTPSVRMEEQKIIFGVPKTTFRLRSIKFDVPQTRFVNKKTGQYPETRCEDTWISLPFGGKTKGVPKCTVTWSDIITKVPEVYLETTEIKTKIPEFTWDNTEIILDVPKFFMERQEIVFDIPEIKAADIDKQRSEIDRSVAGLSQRTDEILSSQQAEIREQTIALYDCNIDSLGLQKSETLEEFDRSFAELDSSIIEIRGHGIDPTNVQSNTGPVNLVAIRDDLAQKRAAAINQFARALDQLHAEKAKALSEF